jgi:predicted nucleotidyltransferase/DNA-binding XRE family transcriptional regulator
MDDLIDIGRELVRRRRQLGITQKRLGERLGVTQPQVARWESDGYRSASFSRVAAVARELGVTVICPDSLLAAEDLATYGDVLPGADPEAVAALARTGVPAGAVAAYARTHGIERLSLFGSVLSSRFGTSSDIDVLVAYTPGRTPSLIEIADYEAELAAIFRRRVDLVSLAGVDASANERTKRSILNDARVLYARP